MRQDIGYALRIVKRNPGFIFFATLEAMAAQTGAAMSYTQALTPVRPATNPGSCALAWFRRHASRIDPVPALRQE